MRLGLIGSGSQRRLQLGLSDDFDLVAVYDSSSRSLAATRELVGQDFMVCRSEEDLLGQPLDAVLIMSLDELRARQLLMTVEANKPVLCKKPLGISLQDMKLVERALSLAQCSGLLVAGCHLRSPCDKRLAYGWAAAHLPRLQRRYGKLVQIRLRSIYPRPPVCRKQDRSFLLEEYVHDAELLLALFSSEGYEAYMIMDSPDHYEVEGAIAGIRFDCQGTQLHGAKDEYIEIIQLNFAKDGRRSSCTVYVKDGRICFRNGWTGVRTYGQILPMDSAGYNRVFAGLMSDFAAAVRGGKRTHTLRELWLITASAIQLVEEGEWW